MKLKYFSLFFEIVVYRKKNFNVSVLITSTLRNQYLYTTNSKLTSLDIKTRNVMTA